MSEDLARAERTLFEAPGRLEAPDRELIRRAGSPTARLRLAEIEVVLDPAAAAEVVRSLPPPPDAPPAHQLAALRVVLALHRDGAAALAARALDAIPPSAEPLDPLCRELDRVPELPHALRSEVARAVLAGDLRIALDAGERFLRTEGARAARRLQQPLSERAPALARLLGWEHPIASVSTRGVVTLVGFVAIASMLALARPGCQRAGRRGPDADTLDGIRAGVLALCGPGSPVAFCAALERAELALRRREPCPVLGIRLEELRADAPLTGPPAELVERVARLVSVRCAP